MSEAMNERELSPMKTQAERGGHRRVIVLGAPGSGKGTQAQSIVSHLAVPHLSTGDIFRRNVGEGTALGQQVKGYMDSGELVPDELTLAMVRQRLEDRDAADGFLLDGFPRSVAQARFLEEVLGEAGTAIDAVLEMHVAEEEILRRLAGRRTCASCGESWHVDFEPPRRAGTCDACGGPLFQRDDDREDAVRRRLELYAQHTSPLVAFFRARGVLTRIEASGSLDAVSSRTLAALTT